MTLKKKKENQTPNVELTGAAPALSAQRPATEGREVERRVGGGGETEKPLFDLHGTDEQRWALYEDGTATGFPEGTVIVNRAITRIYSLLGRIEKLNRTLISDE